MATVMQYPAWPFLPASSQPVSQLNPASQPDACIRIRLTDEDTSKPRGKSSIHYFSLSIHSSIHPVSLP
uniref:Uncharacterized protein n=1 Tax=Panagrellus redivivus TaxID=6233 RepID=A0A7E4VUW7_PANRE